MITTELAIFKKMIPGDDSLLQLAKKRYELANLGAECYPSDPEHLTHLLNLLPQNLDCTAHLPYHLNIFDQNYFEEIINFAIAAKGRIKGFIIHDKLEYPSNAETFFKKMRELSESLLKIKGAPPVFMEYACCMPFSDFFELTNKFIDIEHIYPCIDIGHIAVKYCMVEFEKTYPGINIASLTPTSENITEYITPIKEITSKSRQFALGFIKEILEAGHKKVHFHFHDTHPLSTFSEYNICDHLSFLKQIPLPFQYQGHRLLPCIYGLDGLAQIKKLLAKSPAEISLMFELHPQPGRIPLGEDSDLFSHWECLENAEKMNFWLDMVLNNVYLFRQLPEKC